MALGKPAVTPPRALDLREVSAQIVNIAERLRAIEAALSGLGTIPQTNQASSAPGAAASPTALSRAFSAAGNGLLAKISSSGLAARRILMPSEFGASNADGVNGNPTFSWSAQLPGLVLASPPGSSGPPSFRQLEASDLGGAVLANPMQDFGDMVVGESAGSPARLPPGLEGDVLTIVGGMPTWAEAAGGPGGSMPNPLEDYGDLIVGESGGSPARLPLGSEGQLLTVQSGAPQWADPAATGYYRGCRAYNDGTQTIPTSSSTALTFNTNEWDTAGLHSTTVNPSRFTCPSGLGGKWQVTYKTTFAPGTATDRITFLRKNGIGDLNNIIGGSARGAASASLPFTVNACFTVDMQPGDYIECFVYQASGSSLDVGSAIVPVTERGAASVLEIHYLGPDPA